MAGVKGCLYGRCNSVPLAMSRWKEHHEDFSVGQSLWLGFSRVLEQCFNMACVALEIALASPLLFRMACPYQPCMLSILLVVRPPTPPSPFRPSASFLPKMQISQNEPQIKQLSFFSEGVGGGLVVSATFLEEVFPSSYCNFQSMLFSSLDVRPESLLGNMGG